MRCTDHVHVVDASCMDQSYLKRSNHSQVMHRWSSSCTDDPQIMRKTFTNHSQWSNPLRTTSSLLARGCWYLLVAVNGCEWLQIDLWVVPNQMWLFQSNVSGSHRSFTGHSQVMHRSCTDHAQPIHIYQNLLTTQTSLFGCWWLLVVTNWFVSGLQVMDNQMWVVHDQIIHDQMWVVCEWFTIKCEWFISGFE